MITTMSTLLILTAIGVIYYWSDFYLKGSVHTVKEDWYIKFERAFPPADIWMAGCALVGAIGLLLGQTYGVIFSLLAASSLVFLALMDITFNIQNRLYHLVSTLNQMRFELFLNLWALGLGIALIIYLSPRINTL